jgi:hypothetical protein
MIKSILKKLFECLYTTIITLLSKCLKLLSSLVNYLDLYYPYYRMTLLLVSFYFCLTRLVLGLFLLIYDKIDFVFMRQFYFIILFQAILFLFIYMFRINLLNVTYAIIKQALFPFGWQFKKNKTIFAKIILYVWVFMFRIVEQFFAIHPLFTFLIVLMILESAYYKVLLNFFILLLLLRCMHLIISMPYTFTNNLFLNIHIYNNKLVKIVNESTTNNNDIDFNLASIIKSDEIDILLKSKFSYKIKIFLPLLYYILQQITVFLDIQFKPIKMAQKEHLLVKKFTLDLNYKNGDFLYTYISLAQICQG